MGKAIKMLSLTTAIVLVGSLTFVALGIISWRLFWVVAILAAIIAYYIIPKLKNNQKTQE